MKKLRQLAPYAMAATMAFNVAMPMEVSGQELYILHFPDGDWISTAVPEQHRLINQPGVEIISPTDPRWQILMSGGQLVAQQNQSNINAPVMQQNQMPAVQPEQGHQVVSQQQQVVVQSAMPTRLDLAFPRQTTQSVTTNRVWNNIAIRNFQQAMNIPNEIGDSNFTSMSPQMRQWGDNFSSELAHAVAMESGTEVLKVNDEGLSELISGITIGTFTAVHGGQDGGWDSATQTLWVATHVIDENGNRVAKSMQEIVHIFFYELGRANALGVRLSNAFARQFTGREGPQSTPGFWPTYEGFYHRMGEIVGFDNILDNVWDGQANFTNFINHQLMNISPNMPNYDMLYEAIEAVGGILRDSHLTSQFGNSVGMNSDWDVWEHLASAWEPFYRATDMSLTQVQRDEAAREFLNRVNQVVNFSRQQGGIMSDWNRVYSAHHRNDGRVFTSVLEHNRPFYVEGVGVGTQNSLHGRQSQQWLSVPHQANIGMPENPFLGVTDEVIRENEEDNLYWEGYDVPERIARRAAGLEMELDPFTMDDYAERLPNEGISQE